MLFFLLLLDHPGLSHLGSLPPQVVLKRFKTSTPAIPGYNEPSIIEETIAERASTSSTTMIKALLDIPAIGKRLSVPLLQLIAAYTGATVPEYHPNLVAYYGSIPEWICTMMDPHNPAPPRDALLFEYCNGGDGTKFIEYLEKYHQLPTLHQLCDWWLQLALGLRHLHSLEILHRDLALRNIMWCFHGSEEVKKITLKIGDFGSGKILGASGSTWTKRGISAHNSREIATDPNQLIHYGYPSDVHSLGVIFYELLMHINLSLESITNENAIKALHHRINFHMDHIHVHKRYSSILYIITRMTNQDPLLRPSIGEVCRLLTFHILSP